MIIHWKNYVMPYRLILGFTKKLRLLFPSTASIKKKHVNKHNWFWRETLTSEFCELHSLRGRNWLSMCQNEHGTLILEWHYWGKCRNLKLSNCMDHSTKSKPWRSLKKQKCLFCWNRMQEIDAEAVQGSLWEAPEGMSEGGRAAEKTQGGAPKWCEFVTRRNTQHNN